MQDSVTKAYSYLVRSTMQRPVTVAEAADKLSVRGYTAEVIDDVIAKAQKDRVLDDTTFAQLWVESRQARGYGQQRLRREMVRRKVPDHIVEAVLEPIEHDDERARAIELAQQRAMTMPPSLDPRKVANRLVGFLQRRGYNSAIAYDVARSVSTIDRQWD